MTYKEDNVKAKYTGRVYDNVGRVEITQNRDHVDMVINLRISQNHRISGY
jgi:hypothetical protein